MQLVRLSVCLLLTLALSCSASVHELPIAWMPCPLYTDTHAASSQSPSADGRSVEPIVQCAHVSMPMSQTELPDTFIKVFVKRLVSASATKDVWLLHGGPGIASNALEIQAMQMFTQLEQTADIYLVDHRGVGRSSRIACVAPQAETAGSEGGFDITEKEFVSCAKAFQLRHGNASAHFSTTGAAQDVHNLIRATRDSKQVFLYGLSYGTYWANRVMQLDQDEELITAVALDSIMTASGANHFTFDLSDVHFDQVATQFLHMCANDTFCSQCFGGKNVSVFMHDLFEKLFEKKSCQIVTRKGISAAKLRTILAKMFMSTTDRNLIPALLHRLNRCDDDIDFGALFFFFDAVENRGTSIYTPNCNHLMSPMLQQHIIASQFWQQTPSTQLEQIFNATFISLGSFLHEPNLYQAWSENQLLFAHDKFFNQTFSTQKNVLLLNGNLDPHTPISYARTSEELIEAQKKWLIELPFAPHHTVMNTPVNGSAVHCAMQILLSFIRDPTKEPDSTCKSSTEPLNFKGTMATNKLLLGVNDIWNGFYYPAEDEQNVSLWLFVGTELGIVVTILSVLALVTYWVVEEKLENHKATASGYGQISAD